MIPKYINDWLTIIETMSNQNTYKLAWGRAILECISLDKCYEENTYKVYIKFEDMFYSNSGIYYFYMNGCAACESIDYSIKEYALLED